MTDKDYQKNQKLSAYTSFRLGGLADWLYQVKNEEDLGEVIKFCQQKKITSLILGGGSNILFNDKGFRGMVIKMENREIRIEDERVIAGAGTTLNKLLKLTAENFLTGF